MITSNAMKTLKFSSSSSSSESTSVTFEKNLSIIGEDESEMDQVFNDKTFKIISSFYFFKFYVSMFSNLLCFSSYQVKDKLSLK